MKQHSHQFINTYQGIGAFGMDRETNEETLIYYLQKFSADDLIQILVNRLTDAEIEEMYDLINRFMKSHLTEAEYHALFLREAV